jgi:hypothetical protein
MCQGELLLHYCFILPCGQFRSHIRLFDQHLGNRYFSLPAHPIGEHSFWDMIYCSRSWQDQRNRGVRTHQLLKLWGMEDMMNETASRKIKSISHRSNFLHNGVRSKILECMFLMWSTGNRRLYIRLELQKYFIPHIQMYFSSILCAWDFILCYALNKCCFMTCTISCLSCNQVSSSGTWHTSIWIPNYLGLWL